MSYTTVFPLPSYVQAASLGLPGRLSEFIVRITAISPGHQVFVARQLDAGVCRLRRALLDAPGHDGAGLPAFPANYIGDVALAHLIQIPVLTQLLDHGSLLHGEEEFISRLKDLVQRVLETG